MAPESPLGVLCALGLSLAFGCGPPTIPEPVYGQQRLRDDSYIEVLTPPPPVQPAEIGGPPSSAYVWVDGQWTYLRATGKWTWEDGAWCVPPKNAFYYAKPLFRRVRKPLGRATRWNEFAKRFEEVDSGEDIWLWARGRWYAKDAAGNAIPTSETPTCATQDG